MRYFYSLIQKIIERAYKKSNGLRVYMFHQVNDDQTKWENKGVSITKTGFIQFIDGLIEKKCSFLSVNDLSEDNAISSNVIITFDDIYQDAVDNAIPFLVEKSIPFCVFITENFVDKEGFITNESLTRLMAEPLCTIGFHTKNHNLMRYLKYNKFIYETDCEEFEKRILREVPFFAFPYGSLYACNLKSILSVRAKYKYSFSTISIPCSKWLIKRIPFFLPRINVCEASYKERLEEYFI